MSNFVKFEDKFTVTCNNCGSTNVTLTSYECHECGNLIDAVCENCGSEYKYHNFEKW